MSFATFIFYFFEAMAAAAAIGLVFVRHVFYGAMLLILCLLSLAALYVLAFAEFVAVSQILIYAGGVLVVIIFGIMLTARISGKPLVVEHTNIFGGVLAAGGFFVVLVYFIGRQSFPAPAAAGTSAYNAVQRTGIALMSDFVLPFEVAGILLLVALIGAAVIASFMKSKKAE